MEQKRRFASRQSLIGSNTSYRPWKEWKEGEYLVGIFSGTSKDNFGNNNYTVKVVEADFMDRDAAVALEGKNLTLNECGSLKKIKDDLVKGQAYSFTYNGETILSTGKFAGKKAHSVAIDEVDLNDVQIIEADEGSDEYNL